MNVDSTTRTSAYTPGDLLRSAALILTKYDIVLSFIIDKKLQTFRIGLTDLIWSM